MPLHQIALESFYLFYHLLSFLDEFVILFFEFFITLEFAFLRKETRSLACAPDSPNTLFFFKGNSHNKPAINISVYIISYNSQIVSDFLHCHVVVLNYTARDISSYYHINIDLLKNVQPHVAVILLSLLFFELWLQKQRLKWFV